LTYYFSKSRFFSFNLWISLSLLLTLRDFFASFGKAKIATIAPPIREEYKTKAVIDIWKFQVKNLKSKGILFCTAVMIITRTSKKVMINEAYMVNLLQVRRRTTEMATISIGQKKKYR
jgi:hypothetical protein